MAKDPKLPDRFAKLVLWELADIKALLLCLADGMNTELAQHLQEHVPQEAVDQTSRITASKRATHAAKIYADALKKLNLDESV